VKSLTIDCIQKYMYTMLRLYVICGLFTMEGIGRDGKFWDLGGELEIAGRIGKIW
jgi:hypothetical protein